MESFCSEQIREARALIKIQKQLQPATKDANGIPLRLTWSQTIHHASLMAICVHRNRKLFQNHSRIKTNCAV